MIDKFVDSIINLDIDKAIKLSKDLIEAKTPTTDLFKAISGALDVVGKKYEEKEYFLSELIMAGEVVQEVLKIVEPMYESGEKVTVGTVVLATVRGDLHDLGKNIFAMLLQASGFKVIDLGIDVSAKDIVKAIQDNNADVVGLSALLTTTVPELENVISELEKENMRSKVKVIIGGAAVNDEVAEKYGVDGWGRTAVEGINICKQWFSL
jgi:methylmalonyl-CoA mutase cobalamin-binding domain/chain